MSQGTRGGWARGLIVGLGAALCVTVVGCNEIDKPRFGSATKQPGPGLPGTPTLSGQPGSGNVRTTQPGMGTPPLGGVSTPAGRSPTGGYPAGGNSGFGSAASGNTFVPSVSPSNLDSPPVSPAAGMGAGSAPGSFGGAAPPSLDAPNLYPPAAPDAKGAAVLPPGYGPVAPTQR